MRRCSAPVLAKALLCLVMALLAGCASQRGGPPPAGCLSLLPEDADVYLRFPVRGNQELAGALVAALAPDAAEKGIDRLTERFAVIYGAVKGKEFAAVASGSFPTIALGLVLNRRSGWTATKDKSIPVTGRYYQYRGLPLQVAFPDSSTMVAARQVAPLLDSYRQTGDSLHAPSPSGLLGRFQEGSSGAAGGSGQSVDFYLADVMAFLGPGLGISLPVRDMYGTLTPTGSLGDDGSRLYALDGCLGLPDSRALRPALAALGILARTTGLGFAVSAQEGDLAVRVSGLAISQKTLAGLVSGLLR